MNITSIPSSAFTSVSSSDSTPALPSSLLRAVENSNLVAVRELLKDSKIDPNQYEPIDSDRCTPFWLATLHYTIRKDDLSHDIFTSLIEDSRVDVNLPLGAPKPWSGFSPLHQAAYECHVPAIEAILATKRVRFEQNPLFEQGTPLDVVASCLAKFNPLSEKYSEALQVYLRLQREGCLHFKWAPSEILQGIKNTIEKNL